MSFQVVSVISIFLTAVDRNKAVADGAMSFYIDHCVRTRVSRFTYGQFSNTKFDPHNADHQRRIHDVYTSLSGQKNVKNNFSIILPKVCAHLSFTFPFWLITSCPGSP